jgi:predicted metal-dependent peptidase
MGGGGAGSRLVCEGLSTVSQGSEAVARKIAVARTRLMLERPFLGALVAHLPLVESTRCRGIATDARSIYYNALYLGELTLAETQFVLAHEALHCALNHFARRRSRLAERWNRACDYAVNQMLLDDGMTAPDVVDSEVRYRGLSAEEIYPLLEGDADREGFDEHWFGGSDASAARVLDARRDVTDVPDHSAQFLASHRDGVDELGMRIPMSSAELAATWDDRLVASAHAALEAGRLGANWRAVLAQTTQPRLPWRSLLARFLASVARDDYSFQRPNRRGGEAILPGLASTQANLVVALDTSGSVGTDDLRQFLQEIDALKGQLAARVVLLGCDSAIVPGAPWIFEPWDRLELPNDLAGGGTTRFGPVFEWVRQAGMRPDALLYFTDALGEFPEFAPSYPVLWLVKGNGTVPWGEHVQLNG